MALEAASEDSGGGWVASWISRSWFGRFGYFLKRSWSLSEVARALKGFEGSMGAAAVVGGGGAFGVWSAGFPCFGGSGGWFC